jgi:hypothetical protein
MKSSQFEKVEEIGNLVAFITAQQKTQSRMSSLSDERAERAGKDFQDDDVERAEEEITEFR